MQYDKECKLLSEVLRFSFWSRPGAVVAVPPAVGTVGGRREEEEATGKGDSAEGAAARPACPHQAAAAVNNSTLR
jgi:hypothetical protein